MVPGMEETNGFERFKEKLRVKCVPHYTLQEFEALIERIERTAAEFPPKENTPDDTQVVQTQQCASCRNRDLNFFYFDSKSGDTICLGANGTGCGTVLLDHLFEDGAAHRNFEGEEDRNHYGGTLIPRRLILFIIALSK